MTNASHPTRRLGLLLAACAAALVAVGSAAVPAGAAPSADQLRDRIDQQSTKESKLSSAADRLGALEQQASRAVDLLQTRLDRKQGDLDAVQAKLAATEARLAAQRKRLARLHARLDESRTLLSRLLRDQYMADKPDIVGVVLNSHGFSDLFERIDFVDKIQDRDTAIIDTVRRARKDAATQTRALSRDVPRQRAETADVRTQRDALAGMGEVLQAKRDTLAAAHEARVAALRDTRSSRRSAERTLDRLEAAQAKAAREMAAPAAPSGGGGDGGGTGGTGGGGTSGGGGSWAIPWSVVQCESGGQNLPPNSATASGYYQFIDSTWQAMGGSTPKAYLASKAEQDRLAAKLWNGGAGASNWDCAFIVGIL
jgi:peptidoglycan hydrolase CwlO-like protein